MNIKRIFGTLLIGLGLVGLIYTALLFVNTMDAASDVKALITFGILVTLGILGLIFFISGISLVRTTKDEL